jgi:putative ABC transport system permease protein
MSQDTRLGLRSLFRRPALAFLIVLTLGLGMGVTTALFSLIDGVLLRPLAYHHPESLVWVYGRNTERDSLPLSPPDFLDYRSENQVLSGLAAFQDRDVNLAGGDVPEHIQGAAVSSGFFQMLGVQPLAGNFFTGEEEKSGAQVVILSEDLWRSRFGASTSVIGKTIQLDGKPTVVTGVMPASFRLPDRAHLWVPLTFSGDGMNIRRFHFLYVVGRLKPGVTVKTAQSNLDAIAARLAASFPDSNDGWKTRLVPLKDYVVGDARLALLVMFGAVGIVLLIACANIASLLLVEGIARESEMAIRSALGASRLRLVGQLLTESLLLSVLGAAFGLLLATWSLRLLVALNPGNIPRLEEVHIAPTTFGFVCVLAVLSALLFGLMPALFSSRPNLQSTLRETGRNTTTSTTVRRLSRLLVVGEITLSTALIIGMGLLGKSFFQLSSVDPGFHDDNVLTAGIVLSSPRYTKPNLSSPFFQSVLQRLSTAPGVEAAGVVNAIPLSGDGGDVPFSIEGHPPATPDDQLFAFYRVASADYFKAMSIPLLRGRSFTENDSKDAPKVVIIDQTLAEGLWPGENPLGRRLRIDLGEPFVAEVIGVVGNVRHSGLDQTPFQTLYLSYQQDQWANLNVIVRTSYDPAGVSKILRQAVADLDPAQPVSIRSLHEIVSKSVARPLFNMFLLSVFAILALVLALVGIYGVISYSVSQRRNEIGIRVALGASPWDTFRLVLREGLLLTVLGIGLGLVFALAATRGLASLLYGVTNTDVSIYLGAAVLVVLVTLVACVVPARKAVRIDPLTAIRELN